MTPRLGTALDYGDADLRAPETPIAFDHRAHGESSGKRISFGYHESRDVASNLRALEEVSNTPHKPPKGYR